MTGRSFFSTLAGALLIAILLGGCSSVYFGTMEKVGIHKRDIMTSRVEKARDSQEQAQQQFKSALERFQHILAVQDTDLKRAYEQLDAEYQDCVEAADDVSDRIDKIESVSEALFDEWEDEIELYSKQELARASRDQLDTTKRRYKDMMKQMKQAEASMEPVLALFRDNVLILKHNLNAQAIGSLQQEVVVLESRIDTVIDRMNQAIASSNEFLAGLKTN